MADKSIMSYETVALADEKSALVIMAPTKLPYEVEILSLTDPVSYTHLDVYKRQAEESEITGIFKSSD